MSDLPQQYIGIKLNFPIFKGFSTRQKVAQSKQELQLQELQLENIKLLKQKEDELLLQELKTSAQQLNDSRDILALQKRTMYMQKIIIKMASSIWMSDSINTRIY